MNQKIHLAGQFRQVEIVAAGAISPGMLVEKTSAGLCQAHSTAGGIAERMIAQEDALQGRTVSDAYAATEPVSIASEVPGSRVLGLLKAGSNYTIGMKLISDGAGKFKPTTGSPLQVVAINDVALDLSASAAVDTLNPISIL